MNLFSTNNGRNDEKCFALQLKAIISYCKRVKTLQLKLIN